MANFFKKRARKLIKTCFGKLCQLIAFELELKLYMFSESARKELFKYVICSQFCSI